MLASGVAEIALGLAFVALPRKRRLVGALLAGFFVVVFPGNLAQYLEGTDAFGLDTDTSRLVRLFFTGPGALGAVRGRLVAADPARLTDLGQARSVSPRLVQLAAHLVDRLQHGDRVRQRPERVLEQAVGDRLADRPEHRHVAAALDGHRLRAGGELGERQHAVRPRKKNGASREIAPARPTDGGHRIDRPGQRSEGVREPAVAVAEEDRRRDVEPVVPHLAGRLDAVGRAHDEVGEVSG